MELHVPYYELRELRSSSSSQPEQLIDVSFINANSNNPQNNSKYGIYDARFSLLICGPDHVRWTGFAFVNNGLSTDGEGAREGDSEFEEDPIASQYEGGRCFGIVGANSPIYDPREYYILVMGIRLAAILEHWRKLGRWLELSIGEHVCLSSLLQTSPHGIRRDCTKHYPFRIAGSLQMSPVKRSFGREAMSKTRCKPSTGHNKR